MTQAIAKEEAARRADLPGGFAGKLLRVDLTTGRCWAEPWSARRHARCTSAASASGRRSSRDEVPAKVDWDHPDNRLILATARSPGLPVWGTGGLTVVTIGAVTNGATSTQANGFFGTNLKYCGYDAIVIQGQSQGAGSTSTSTTTWSSCATPGHLVGKDTWETQDALSASSAARGHSSRVYSIGPAGENLVRFAAIQGDYGHVASKNGVRRRDGQEEAEGGGHRARDQGAARGRPARAHRRPPTTSPTTSRPIPRRASLYEYGTLPGRREPRQARRAADQELHDQRHPPAST